MQAAFVDTSAFVALVDPLDTWHEKAVPAEQILAQEQASLVTTNFILDETYTTLRGKVRHSVIVRLGESIRKSRKLATVRISEAIEESAWDIFVRYEDKDFSYTDCTSFVVMKQLDMATAFVFDRHFDQFGFTRLPDVTL